MLTSARSICVLLVTMASSVAFVAPVSAAVSVAPVMDAQAKRSPSAPLTVTVPGVGSLFIELASGTTEVRSVVAAATTVLPGLAVRAAGVQVQVGLSGTTVAMVNLDGDPVSDDPAMLSSMPVVSLPVGSPEQTNRHSADPAGPSGTTGISGLPDRPSDRPSDRPNVMPTTPGRTSIRPGRTGLSGASGASGVVRVPVISSPTGRPTGNPARRPGKSSENPPRLVRPVELIPGPALVSDR